MTAACKVGHDNAHAWLIPHQAHHFPRFQLHGRLVHPVVPAVDENGHIAFNDPPVADFADPKLVKVVELDEACRRQQAGEGWFATIDDVPQQAITLTVPAIMRCEAISCVVPDERKAQAVKACVAGPISTACPASILRQHANAILWLDEPASSLVS